MSGSPPDPGHDSSRFGRYEVEEEVARGGMGVIYRVRDPEMRRFLAMKVLLPPDEKDASRDADSESRRTKLSARFTDEAQLTGQLDHPGIIPVYDMGRDADGRLFFTMRLVKGRTLEELFDLVRDGKDGWTVTRALGVLQKVCEAMAFAHDRGVIHRDLKPSNVMVGRFGETYVVDWGLAKLVDEAESAPAPEKPVQTVLTSARKDESSRGGDLGTLEGDVMGTPAYMAPEQAQGKVARVGPRADIYSLGAMLYHLLVGHPPYRPDGESVSAREVLDRLLEGPPPSVEREARDVPAELAAICDRAMAREPGARYASMLDVAEDLQAYVENRVVQAYRRGAALEFKKWVQRNRATAASLLLALLLALAGLAAVTWVQTRSKRAVQVANTELASTVEALESANAEISAARDEANQNALVAKRNEERALATEREARWSSYVANIAAASANLETGATAAARGRLAACPEDLRGWEWRLLSHRAEPSLGQLEGGETYVGALDFSPDGRLLAVAPISLDGLGEGPKTVRIWDVDRRELVQVLDAHDANVLDVEFSPSGTELVSCSFDLEYRVWDVETGELVLQRDTWTRETSPYSLLWSSFEYLPDGLRIVSGWSNGQLLLWDLSDNSLEILSQEWGSWEPRVSPDGRFVASAPRTDEARGEPWLCIYDLTRRKRLSQIDLTTGLPPGDYHVEDLDFSPDGTRAACILGQGQVQVVELESERVLFGFEAHEWSGTAVRFSPSGALLATAGNDRTVRLWGAENGELLETLLGHSGYVKTLEFSPSGDQVASGGWESVVRLWDGQPGATVTQLRGFGDENPPSPVDFDPTGERFLWASHLGNCIRVTDARTGVDLCTLPSVEGKVWACTFDASGERILALCTGRLRVFDATTGELLELRGDLTDTRRAAFDADGTRAAICTRSDSGAAEIRILDPATGAVLHRWEHGIDKSELAFSENGLLAVADARGVQVHDADTGELVRAFDSPGMAAGVAMSPAGDWVALAKEDGRDRSVSLFSVEEGTTRRFEARAKPWVVAFHPDGDRVLSSNWDRTISLWEPERGEIFAFKAHPDTEPTDIAFSPDGSRMGNAGIRGYAMIWDTTSLASRLDVRRAAARERLLERRVAPLVEELRAELVLASDVAAAIDRRRDLDDDEKKVATRLARAASFHPREDVFPAIQWATEPGATPDVYLRVLRVFELAVALLDEPEVWPDSYFLLGLGAAQYRMGRFEEARATLETCDRAASRRATDLPGTRPPTPLFLAMALARTGDLEGARRIVDRERTQLRFARGSTVEARRVLEIERKLLGEAEALLDELR